MKQFSHSSRKLVAASMVLVTSILGQVLSPETRATAATPSTLFTAGDRTSWNNVISYSYLSALNGTGYCEKLATSGDCSAVGGSLIFGFCKTNEQSSCIEGVRINDRAMTYIGEMDGDWQFVNRNRPNGHINRDDSNGIPAGGTPLFFQDQEPSGPKNYVVKVQQAIGWTSKNGREGKPQLGGISIQVAPFTMGSMGRNYELLNQCVFVGRDFSSCGVSNGFQLQSTIKLSLRISNASPGWFMGQVTSAAVAAEKYGQGNTRYVFSGSPASIPTVSFKYDALSEEERHCLPNEISNWVSAWGNSAPKEFQLPGNLSQTFDCLRAPNVKATKDVSIWRFDGASISPSGIASSCTSSEHLSAAYGTNFIGYQATDAPVWDDYVPRFTSNGIEYKLRGPHYRADGLTPFEGNYTFALSQGGTACFASMDSRYTAQNLAKVTVSVLDDNGQPKVAVTSIQSSGGALRVTASGFTFSSPTIRIAPTALRAIVCRKKTNTKITKIVSGINPKCPSGYLLRK